MSLALVAQAGFAAALGGWAIILIIVAGIIGIAFIVARAAGLTIPPMVVQILWVVFAVCVGVVAIKFILSLL